MRQSGAIASIRTAPIGVGFCCLPTEAEESEHRHSQRERSGGAILLAVSSPSLAHLIC